MKQLIPPTLKCLVLLSLCISACQSTAVDETKFDAQVLMNWNKMIMQWATEEDGLLTLKGVRTEALMHTAMHDALNAIKPVYSTYLEVEEAPTAQPVVAVAQAAFEIAIIQFPEKRPELEAELAQWVGAVQESKIKQEGIALGKAVAAKILSARSDDKWNTAVEYTWHPMAPGVYADFKEHSGTPEGFIFGAGWAKAQPFLLREQAQFRSPPPPEIASTAYTKAFDEVKAFGRYDSALRSKDQTHLAMWWKDFVEHSHNQLAQELVAKEGLNLWEAARLFALLNLTIYDAYINVFDNKFFYNHWRPYTAIRWADNDGNADTEVDREWNNLHKHTYAFPSYPSAHGTASTAAMTVLAGTLGRGDDYAFTMTIEEVDRAGPFSGKVKMDPPTRTFTSFSQAGLEASLSRVYLGIHFRYDSEEGHRLGAEIGKYAVQNFLKPLH